MCRLYSLVSTMSVELSHCFGAMRCVMGNLPVHSDVIMGVTIMQTQFSYLFANDAILILFHMILQNIIND